MATCWVNLCLLLSVALCLGARAQEEEQSLSLLQTSFRVDGHEQLRRSPQGSEVALAETSLARESTGERFNCSLYPGFCKAPFNCQRDLPVRSLLEPQAADGHADLHQWCAKTLAERYYPYLDTCINKKDLRRAGQIQFKWSREQSFPTDEFDGSYCFMEGHCSNTAVTANTTLEEAEKMCDERYGHDVWTSFSPAEPWSLAAISRVVLDVQSHNGFSDSRSPRVFLMLACQMGNYHCDVMYCKETYCQDPYYVNKYQHLMPDTPGHLLRQHEWHPSKVDLAPSLQADHPISLGESQAGSRRR